MSCGSWSERRSVGVTSYVPVYGIIKEDGSSLLVISNLNSIKQIYLVG